MINGQGTLPWIGQVRQQGRCDKVLMMKLMGRDGFLLRFWLFCVGCLC